MTFMLNQKTGLSQRDRNILVGFLTLVAAFTAFDIFEDSIEGITFTHALIESIIVLASLGGAVFLWIKTSNKLLKQTNDFKLALEKTLIDNQKFKTENQQIYQGFVKAVETQLLVWGLSEAERDIAFLLLKGLSIKEIANVRNSSEHTVRQQSANIYKKANLEGRAHLAAFFLEDIFDTPKS